MGREVRGSQTLVICMRRTECLDNDDDRVLKQEPGEEAPVKESLYNPKSSWPGWTRSEHRPALAKVSPPRSKRSVYPRLPRMTQGRKILLQEDLL